MLLTPSFISLFPREEFIALDLISKPSFARFSPILFPDCFHLLFLILFKAAANRLNLTFFRSAILWTWFILFRDRITLFFVLGLIFLTFFTLMFVGFCFSLILSYLAVKVVPFGRVTIFWDFLRLSTIFSLIFFFFFYYDLYLLFFWILVLLFRLTLGRQKMLAAQLVFPQPFVFLPYPFFFFFPPNIPKAFVTDCFPLLIPRNLHHFDLLCIFCTLKLFHF